MDFWTWISLIGVALGCGGDREVESSGDSINRAFFDTGSSAEVGAGGDAVSDKVYLQTLLILDDVSLAFIGFVGWSVVEDSSSLEMTITQKLPVPG